MFEKFKKKRKPDFSKPIEVHVGHHGGVWVDLDEFFARPKVKRQLAMRLEDGIPVYADESEDTTKEKSR